MSEHKSKQQYWLGIDLGGTKILAEVYDQDFKLIGSKKRKTKAELGQKAGLERLLKTAREAVEDADLKSGQLCGVGIGCPGVLNLNTGMLIKAPNLGWKDVPIQDILAKEFDAPAAVANDVDAGTFGEFTCGAGKGATSVFGIFPGTGIGGALIYEGKIFKGRNQSCMEIGHLQAVPNGPLCGCGRKGCLEAVAGRLAISTAASAAVIRGQAPWLQKNVGSDPANIRSGALADAVKNGDKIIEELIIDSCNSLGKVLGGIVNLLAPDVMIIGGGLAEAMPTLYLETVRTAMEPKIMNAFIGSCELRIAQLGDHATALGAAAWIKSQQEQV
ncbi:ROK family protein [Kiritimatiellota bacterium B12222]|nr:ROK family protein [Kiritimatiellota bacterium B12222]